MEGNGIWFGRFFSRYWYCCYGSRWDIVLICKYYLSRLIEHCKASYLRSVLMIDSDEETFASVYKLVEEFCTSLMIIRSDILHIEMQNREVQLLRWPMHLLQLFLPVVEIDQNVILRKIRFWTWGRRWIRFYNKIIKGNPWVTLR